MTDERTQTLLTDRLQDHELRVRELERQMQNNMLVISTAKWIGVTVVSSAITVVFSTIGTSLI